MNKKLLIAGFIIAVLVAAILSPFASSYPDGLERVAEDKGFIVLAGGKELIKTWMPDYVFPGINHEGVATALAGIIGTILVLIVLYGIGKLLVISFRQERN
jgi:cobalt/nickel transport protein